MLLYKTNSISFRLFVFAFIFQFSASFSSGDVVEREEAEANLSQNNIILKKNRQGTTIALSSPIIRFSGQNKNREPLTVDLIGSIHFADSSYYAQINDILAGYESVLVEMVLPKGMMLSEIVPKRSSSNRSPQSILDLFAILQEESGHFLGLVSQIESIDYQAQNMLLADIDANRLADLIAQNREIERFIGEMILSLFEPPVGSEEENGLLPGLILLSNDRKLTLRRYIAAKIVEEGEDIPFFDKTLIVERNGVALKKLAEQIAAGDHRIAIFYGAAHLPDLSKRLSTDFGLTEIGREWITAWDLQQQKKSETAVEDPR